MKDIAIAPSVSLDARDLRLVLALAKAGTTSRAAEELHLTQPAVSRALLGLEQRLGVRLFERTTRGLEATEAGRRMIDEAPRSPAALHDLELRLREPELRPTHIRLTCECYTAYHWLPSALERLRERLPGLDVEVAAEHTADPVGALLENAIDVALLTAASVPRRTLEEKPLFSDELVFIVAATHPLASRRTLTPADLREETLLTSSAPTREMHWFLDAVVGNRRRLPRYRLLPLTEAVLDFARAKAGVAVLSEWIARPHLERGDLVAKRLASGPLRRPWRMAWRPEMRQAAQHLSAVLQASSPR